MPTKGDQRAKRIAREQGNVITRRPALVITRAEMDRALDILDTAIGEVDKGDQY
jgi:4-aminobutyrate aminotransferase-like enzyme